MVTGTSQRWSSMAPEAHFPLQTCRVLIRHLKTAAIAGFLFPLIINVASADEAPGVIVDAASLRLQDPAGASGIQALSDSDIDELLTGKTVVRSGAPQDGSQDDEISVLAVQGWRIINAPRLLVWLTLLGAAGDGPDSVTQAMLERRENGSYVKYQHLDLPWPIANRHWVILVDKDVGLAEASGGRVWRHQWSLVDDGPQRIRDAIHEGSITSLRDSDMRRTVYLPSNRGAWTLVKLSAHQTLVAAWYDFDLGGLFPGPLVRAFMSRQLRAGLGSIDELVAGVDRSYTGSRVIQDGCGSPIDPQDVLRVADEWRDQMRLARFSARAGFQGRPTQGRAVPAAGIRVSR